ncbi:MAG TPA: helix-turn-helix transcriptional regulator [Verrucomicrobiae bacterium]
MKKLRRRRSLKNKRGWLRLAKEARFNASRLAKLCGITLRQLERQAQQTLGCTPQTWLDEQRMVAAQLLLRETDTVKEVAFRLGYTQASHFCRQFKQYYELTPTQFILQCERLDRDGP